MSLFSVGVRLGCFDSQWFAASGGRHAQLVPLAGEEQKKSKVEREVRHVLSRA